MNPSLKQHPKRRAIWTIETLEMRAYLSAVAFASPVDSAAGTAPDLVASFLSTNLPTDFAPGESGVVKFKLTNRGDAPAQGTIYNDFYLSQTGSTTLGETLVIPQGSLLYVNKLNLAPSKSIILTGTFVVPPIVPLGTCYLVEDVDTSGTVIESDTSNNVAISPKPFNVVYECGKVDGRSNVTLAVPGVSFKLAGPGTGTLDQIQGNLSFVHTTAASALTITGIADPNKAGTQVQITGISDASPMGSINGATTTIVSNGAGVVLSAGIRQINLQALQNESSFVSAPSFSIGGGPAPVIELQSIVGAAITSTVGIKSLSVSSMEPDTAFPQFPESPTFSVPSTIMAPWIGSITSTGDFIGNVHLTGRSNGRGITLGSASISGAVSDSNWSITGNIGQIVADDPTPELWTLGVRGQIKSFTDNDFGGTLAAGEIGYVLINGDLSGDILAGASLGADGVLGGGDDTFVAGSIGSCQIVGNATATAIVAAGLNPVDDVLLNGNDTLLPGGSIKAIHIAGVADPASRFLAASLPATVSIGGATVIPSMDPRFQLSSTPG